jgi:hypothetical protein
MDVFQGCSHLVSVAIDRAATHGGVAFVDSGVYRRASFEQPGHRPLVLATTPDRMRSVMSATRKAGRCHKLSELIKAAG